MRKKAISVILIFIATIAIAGYFAIPPLATTIIRNKILENPANGVDEIHVTWNGPQIIRGLHVEGEFGEANIDVEIANTLLSLASSDAYNVSVVGNLVVKQESSAVENPETEVISEVRKPFSFPEMVLSVDLDTVTFVSDEPLIYKNFQCDLTIEPGRIFHFSIEGKTDLGGSIICEGSAPDLLTLDGGINWDASGSCSFNIDNATLPTNAEEHRWSIVSSTGSVSTSKLSEAINLNMTGEFAELSEPTGRVSAKGIITLGDEEVSEVELTAILSNKFVRNFTNNNVRGETTVKTVLVTPGSFPLNKLPDLSECVWKTTAIFKPEFLPSELLGATTTANVKIVVDTSGQTVYVTDGKSFDVSNRMVKDRVTELKATLRLTDDMISTYKNTVASCKVGVSKSLPKSFLRDLGPVLSDIVSINTPIKLELTKLKMNYNDNPVSSLCAELLLKIGEVQLAKKSLTLPILNIDLFSDMQTVSATFDPIKINVVDGIVKYDEFRLLVDNKYSISYSGTVDFNNKILNLKYIIPPALSGFLFDVVVTITGTIDNPQLNPIESIWDTANRLLKNN